MIWKIIKDINLREYFPLHPWCFPLRNLNCNDDCLACLGCPTVSLASWQGTDEVRINALMMMMMMIMMKCFCGLVDWPKVFSLISSQDHCQRSFIANLWHSMSRVWTCTEPEFRLSWMKLCRSDNHYTTAPQQLINITTS